MHAHKQNRYPPFLILHLIRWQYGLKSVASISFNYLRTPVYLFLSSGSLVSSHLTTLLSACFSFPHILRRLISRLLPGPFKSHLAVLFYVHTLVLLVYSASFFCWPPLHSGVVRLALTYHVPFSVAATGITIHVHNDLSASPFSFLILSYT